MTIKQEQFFESRLQIHLVLMVKCVTFKNYPEMYHFGELLIFSEEIVEKMTKSGVTTGVCISKDLNLKPH